MPGTGTKDDPWQIGTPPGTSEYAMYRDDEHDPPAIVCRVGKTTLMYDARTLDDLHAMLVEHGDWMPLGSADEQKPAAGQPSAPAPAPAESTPPPPPPASRLDPRDLLDKLLPPGISDNLPPALRPKNRSSPSSSAASERSLLDYLLGP